MKIKLNGMEACCENRDTDCNCEKGNSAMVFIQVQELNNVYSLGDAYKNGTLFPELNKPFYMGGCLGE